MQLTSSRNEFLDRLPLAVTVVDAKSKGQQNKKL